MKNIFLITVLFILTSTFMFAQKLNLGVKTGLNLSEQRFKLDIASTPFNLETSNKTSFHIGVFGELMFSDNLGLNAEIFYSKEGSAINLDAGFDTFEFNQNIDYLNVPILLKYKIIQNKLSFMAGPQLSFLLDDSIDLDADDGEVIDPAYKSFDFGIALGLEYEVIKNLLVGSRYNLGITDITEDSDGGSIKNSTLQFYLGYKLF